MLRRKIIMLLRSIEKLIKIILLGFVYAYRLLISPLIGYPCRYTPSCSEYSLQALKIHGAYKGFYLTTRRLLRCHPWGGRGYDPVPDKK